MRYSTSFSASTLFLISFISTLCLSKPVPQGDMPTSGTAPNVANKVTVTAYKDNRNTVIVISWSELVKSWISAADANVKEFGYDWPVPGNVKYSQQAPLPYGSGALGVDITKKLSEPALAWGTVWDTLRYIYDHLEDYRDQPRSPNQIVTIGFSVNSAADGKLLATGDLGKVNPGTGVVDTIDPNTPAVNVAPS